MTMYVGGEGNDTIFGSSLGDFIKGRGGDDVLNGRAGNDVIDGGEGYDQIDGGAGDDQLITGFGSALVFGGDGSDTIALKYRAMDNYNGTYDPSNLETIYCDAGNGNDRILISSNDLNTGSLIDGSTGYDTIYIMGGAGQYSSDFTNNIWSSIRGFEAWSISAQWDNLPSDLTKYYSPYWSDHPVLIDNRNFDGVADLRIKINAGEITTIDASAVTLGSIDVNIVAKYANYPITVIGGSGNDSVIANDMTFVEVFRGNGGDDYFDGKDGVDVAVFSGNSSDYVVTEILYNTFTVHDNREIDGTDTIVDVNVLRFADGDQEVVIKGMYIVGDDTSEVLSGAAEADFVDGHGGNDTLNGAEGNDHILGGSGNDRLTGADGNDKIEGGLGDDLIVGGSGAGNDSYVGGAGMDTVQYSSALLGIVVDLTKTSATGAEIGVDTLSGVENITAGQGGDMITGSAGNNRLSGLGGADGLAGGAGKDVLIGGLGKDILSGQLGRDTFDFNSAAESTVANYVRHGQGDHVDLMSIDATSGGVNNIFLFAGTQSFAAFNATHDGGVVRAVAGVVEVDIGGNGTVDMVIKTPGVTLHADDFFL